MTAGLAVCGPASAEHELADPHGWKDLLAHEGAVVDAVQLRLREQRTPHRGQVFRWPKDRGGYRPMAWIDPFDQLIYRAFVGRITGPIAASLDRDSVLSPRLAARPPRWTLAEWGTAVAERRQRARLLLESHPVLGQIDISNFFPSIARPVLMASLDSLPLHRRTVEALDRWLSDMDQLSGIKGVPTGHDGSQMLAAAVLRPADDLLRRLGVPFMRFVDDTWFFVDDMDEYEAIVEAYGRTAASLGLELHPAKTRPLTGFDALEEIERFAIQYFGDLLDAPGDDGREAGQHLFDYAMEAPLERKSELRRALRSLTAHLDRRPFVALAAEPELARLAPHQWVRYLRAMLMSGPGRSFIGVEWVVQQMIRPVTKTDAFLNLLVFQAAKGVHVGKDHGREIFNVAVSEGGWSAPIRIWAADQWGRSDAFRPHVAVEQVEERGDFCSKRGFALTLEQAPGGAALERLIRRIRLTDHELEPTARWLESAA